MRCATFSTAAALALLLAVGGCVRAGFPRETPRDGAGDHPSRDALTEGTDVAVADHATADGVDGAADTGAADVDLGADLTVDALAGPTVNWVEGFGDTGYDRGAGVAVDGSGNVFLVGAFQGTVDFGLGALTATGQYDGFLASFDSSGTPRWVRHFDGADYDEGTAVAVDGAGNVTVCGTFRGAVDYGFSALTSAGGNDIFVASFDSNGALRWGKHFGGPDYEDCYSLSSTPAGEVVIAGYFNETIDFGLGPLAAAGQADGFWARLDSTGDTLHAAGVGGPLSDAAWAAAVDGTGNTTVVGHFWGTVDFGLGPLTSAGNSDVFIASFDGAGAARWAARFGATSADSGRGIAIDQADNITIVGRFWETIDFGGGPLTSAGSDDVFVASFANASGAYRWARRFGSTSFQRGAAIASDVGGGVTITGSFWNDIDFDGRLVTAVGADDVFVAGLDSGGAVRWAGRLGGSSGEESQGVAVDPQGRVLLTGTFSHTVDFGPAVLTSAGLYDMFLVQLEP